MDKEKLMKWLTQMAEQHRKRQDEHDANGNHLSAYQNQCDAIVYEGIIEEIEDGKFDKEVTPCKNVTPATTE